MVKPPMRWIEHHVDESLPAPMLPTETGIHVALLEMGREARRRMLVDSAVAKLTETRSLASLTNSELSALSATALARIEVES